MVFAKNNSFRGFLESSELNAEQDHDFDALTYPNLLVDRSRNWLRRINIFTNDSGQNLAVSVRIEQIIRCTVTRSHTIRNENSLNIR